MKKILLICIAVMTIAGCQKEPDLGKLSDEYLTFTSYDNAFDFTSATKIYVPQTITLIDSPDGTFNQWDDSFAAQITNEFANKFAEAGYTVTRDIAEADIDLKLNVSYLQDITLFIDYPYWWWDPFYFWDGLFPGWYFPYPIVYGYAVGSLIAELVDPVVELTSDTELPTKWYVYIGGEEFGDESVITPFIIRGVDKAFEQSPYINK